MMDYVQIIESKRDGRELSRDQFVALIEGYMAGSMTDYQMSAWLMAAFLKGLSLQETLFLTEAMIASGEKIDLSVLGRRVVDKHSTGGVGDKVSMVLGPLVASCGAVFGKMSGRGLGHTGGTVDKLESIPGFRTTVDTASFKDQLGRIGICIAGQSANLVPADDRLYSLRDVTATVDSDALTAASIMSKKVAAGANVVVLDIKVGSGAFFKNVKQASQVALLMERIGEAHDMAVTPVMTSMEQPLGHAVGNSLEVIEAVETLKGRGPGDLVEVVVTLAAHLLSGSDLGWKLERSKEEALAGLSDGRALEKFKEWINTQGGDGSFVDDYSLLPVAPPMPVKAQEGGYVSSVDALSIGRTVLGLGAGRRKKDDRVDHSVGAVIRAKAGDLVRENDEIATVYAATESAATDAAEALKAAYTYSEGKIGPLSPVIIQNSDFG